MTLSLGASGQEVSDLQILLGAAGYEVPLSGLFDPHPEYAVDSFQISANLPADGVYGPETASALIAQVPSTQAQLSPAIDRQRTAVAKFGPAPMMVVTDTDPITGKIGGKTVMIGLVLAAGIFFLLMPKGR